MRCYESQIAQAVKDLLCLSDAALAHPPDAGAQVGLPQHIVAWALAGAAYLVATRAGERAVALGIGAGAALRGGGGGVQGARCAQRGLGRDPVERSEATTPTERTSLGEEGISPSL